jgi:hypothetical protein
MTAPLTDETITDAMIEALRLEADAHSDWQMSEICLRALTLAWPFSAADRGRCADAINQARARSGESGEHPVACFCGDPKHWPAGMERCATCGRNKAAALSRSGPPVPTPFDCFVRDRPDMLCLLSAADALMDAVADCESDARRALANGDDSGEQYERERATGLRAVAVWLREIA